GACLRGRRRARLLLCRSDLAATLRRGLGQRRAADLVTPPDLRDVAQPHRDLVLLVVLLAAPALEGRAAAQHTQTHRAMLPLPARLAADLRLVLQHSVPAPFPREEFGSGPRYPMPDAVSSNGSGLTGTRSVLLRGVASSAKTR